MDKDISIIKHILEHIESIFKLKKGLAVILRYLFQTGTILTRFV